MRLNSDIIMRNLLLGLFAVLFHGIIIANNHEIDSLKTELSLIKNNDKNKLCEIYQNLAVCYETINLDSTLHYADKGLSLYDKPDYGNWSYLQLINTKANYYYSIGDFEKARDGFASAVGYSVNMKDRDYAFDAMAAMSLGVVYRKLGKQDSTIYYYNKAADYGRLSGDYETLSSIYYNTGAMYFGNGRYEDATGNANYAVEYADKSGDFIMQIYSRILLGSCHARMGKYAESVEVLKKNISNAIQHDSPLMAMSSLSPLLSSYQLWNKKDSVAPYLETGNELIHKIPEGHPTALEYIGVLSSVYNWLGEYAKSNELLLGNKQITAQINDVKYHILLAKNYYGQGDYKKAYTNLQTAYELNDSISKAKISKDMTELNAKYNVNAKELEISRLERDRAEQKARQLSMGLYLGSIILVLLVLVLVLQYKRRIQRKEAELVSVRKYIEGLENERKRFAKELHDGVCNDLYGAILQIQRSEITKESKDEAIRLIDTIRNGVRSISHELMPPSFKLADINEMLDSYLFKIQNQSGISINFTSYSDMDWIKIPHDVSYEAYRISQEIIGNIIKHSNAREVRVYLNVEHGRMKLGFAYKGIWNDNNGKCTGIGLRTIEDRIKMIGGKLEITGNDGIAMEIFVNLSDK